MIRSVAITALLLLLASPATHAQVVPGAAGSARARGEVQQYRARTRAEVRRTLNLLEDAWGAGNAPAVDRLFTRDAVVLEPGGEPVADSARAAWVGRELARGIRPSLRIDDFDTSGDLAFAACTWLEGPALEAPRRTAVMVLRRGRFEGEWEIRSLTITPASAPQPPATGGSR